MCVEVEGVSKVNGLRGLYGMAQWLRQPLERWFFASPIHLPLKSKQRIRIEESLRSCVVGKEPVSKTKKLFEFPTVEELLALWPLRTALVRALEPINRGDTYFHELGSQNRQRRLSKGLFDIWLSMNFPFGTVLEIGSRTGVSLIEKLIYHPSPDAVAVLSMDLYVELGSPRIIKRNMRYLGIPIGNVHLLTGDSLSIFPKLMTELPYASFDYALVDGSHIEADAYQDLCNVIPFIRSGGFLVFDDTGPDEYGNYQLLETWERAMASCKEDFTAKHYDEPYGFCVAQRLR